MSKNVMEVADANLNKVLASDKLVLIDFWASWCGPCKLMAPVIDEIAVDFADRIVVGKLNIDENEESAARFDIMSIPTILLFKNGEVVDKVTGLRQKNVIENLITKNI